MKSSAQIIALRPFFAALAISCCFRPIATASSSDQEAAPAPPSLPGNTHYRPPASELLQGVLTRLPRGNFTVSGTLVTRQPGENRPRQNLGFEADFSFSDDRFVAVYRITDAFGDEQERLIAVREVNQAPVYDLQHGGALAPERLSDWQRPVEGTALTWLDLTLSFLWWTNGVTIGRQEVKQQPCWVVDVWPPTEASGPYARMRLWLDTRVGMLLQAEGYDRQGALLRRLSVKSFKKIGEDWMIKDMEAKDVTSELVTVLRVREMTRNDVAAPPVSEENETLP